MKELKMIGSRSPANVFLQCAADGCPAEFVSDNIHQFGYSSEDFTSGHLPWIIRRFDGKSWVERKVDQGANFFTILFHKPKGGLK